MQVLLSEAIVIKLLNLRDILQITVEKRVGDPAEMSIIEVGLLSGFSAVEQTIQRLATEQVADGMGM